MKLTLSYVEQKSANRRSRRVYIGNRALQQNLTKEIAYAESAKSFASYRRPPQSLESDEMQRYGVLLVLVSP